jgi:hypothetical protein
VQTVSLAASIQGTRIESYLIAFCLVHRLDPCEVMRTWTFAQFAHVLVTLGDHVS